MKMPLLRLPVSIPSLVALAAVVIITHPAYALPFALRTNLASISTPAQATVIAAQFGGSPELEVFNGGNRIHADFQTGAPGLTALPDFLFAPYTASDPVTWRYGYGDAGDIDGDGDIDIVRSAKLYYGGTAENRARMMTCRNNGTGVFSAGWQWANNNYSDHGGIPLKLADLDRDGDLDLIEMSAGMTVRWNPGDGNFGGASTVVVAQPLYCIGLETADFDGDGWLDIAAFNYPPNGAAYGGTITVIKNNAGSFTSNVEVSLALNDVPVQIAARDIDRDGRPDLVAMHLFNGGGSGANDYAAINWYRNNGVGFAAGVNIATTATGRFEGAFSLGDVDEDGDIDLVFTDASRSAPYGLSLFLCRRGAGSSFGLPVKLADIPASGQTVLQRDGMTIADNDGDGDNDILFGFGGRMLENTAIHPKGGSQLINWGGTSPTGTTDLGVADINGDGKEDLIAACTTDKKILWYPGGSNSITAPIVVSTGSRAATSVAAADFDRDGDMDLAYATTNEVRRLLSFNGAGTTWSEGSLSAFSGVNEITAADADADGDTDILATAAGTLRWYRNNGDATVWAAETIATGFAGGKCSTPGQMIPGGRLEVVSLRQAGGASVAGTYQHNGAAWSLNGSTTINSQDTSSAILLADIATNSGLEQIFAAGQNSVRIPLLGVTLPALSGPIHNLEPVDWNQDGFNDLLCAYSGGVIVYLNMDKTGLNWTPLYLAARDDYQDAVPMDINHDGLPDAAAVKDDGSIVLILNASFEVSLTQTALHPAGGAVKIAPGSAGGVIALGVTNHGSNVKVFASDFVDAGAMPETAVLRFYKAVASGNAWTVGSAMTLAEIQQAVESVDVDGVPAAAPAALSGSNFIATLPSNPPANIITGPGTTRTLPVRVTLKPTAGAATYTRFFVEHVASGLGVSTRWVSADPALPALTRTLRADVDVSSRAALVEIDSLSSLEQWRLQNFGQPDGAGQRANDADYDKDGVPNLVEYVTGTSPLVRDGTMNAANGIFLTGPDSPEEYLSFRLRISTAAMADVKLKLTIQQSPNLSTWTTLASRVSAGSWTGLAPYNTIAGGGTSSVLFLTSTRPVTTPKFYLRLKAEELP